MTKSIFRGWAIFAGLLLILWFLNLTPVRASGPADCQLPFSRILESVQDVVYRLNWLNNAIFQKSQSVEKGRAQLSRIQEIYEMHWKRAAKLKMPWSDYVVRWENDLKEEFQMVKQAGVKKPKIELEEMLALYAARSPSFNRSMIEYLSEFGVIRKKSRVKEIFETNVKLTNPDFESPEGFAKHLVEVSASLFRAIHPGDEFWKVWCDAALCQISEKKFQILKEYTSRLQRQKKSFRRYLEDVSDEALLMKARPEVIAEMHDWGIEEAIVRRLAALKKIKNPLKRENLIDDEVEKLSYEVLFFIRPAMTLQAATTLPKMLLFSYRAGRFGIDHHFDAQERIREQTRIRAEYKMDPSSIEKYIPEPGTKENQKRRKQDENESLKRALEDQIQKKEKLEREIALLSEEQKKSRERELDNLQFGILDKKIGILQYEMEELSLAQAEMKKAELAELLRQQEAIKQKYRKKRSPTKF